MTQQSLYTFSTIPDQSFLSSEKKTRISQDRDININQTQKSNLGNQVSFFLKVVAERSKFFIEEPLKSRGFQEQKSGEISSVIKYSDKAIKIQDLAQSNGNLSYSTVEQTNRGSFQEIHLQGELNDENLKMQNPEEKKQTEGFERVALGLNFMIGQYMKEIQEDPINDNFSFSDLSIQNSEQLDEEYNQKIKENEKKQVKSKIYKRIIQKMSLSIIGSCKTSKQSSNNQSVVCDQKSFKDRSSRLQPIQQNRQIPSCLEISSEKIVQFPKCYSECLELDSSFEDFFDQHQPTKEDDFFQDLIKPKMEQSLYLNRNRTDARVNNYKSQSTTYRHKKLILH